MWTGHPKLGEHHVLMQWTEKKVMIFFQGILVASYKCACGVRGITEAIKQANHIGLYIPYTGIYIFLSFTKRWGALRQIP